MNRVFPTSTVLALIAGGATAGGVERSAQSTAILFEDGTYAEFSLGYVDPTVSGIVGGVVSSGDMSASYMPYSLGYKRALSDRLDMAVIIDQPIGADVDYPTGTGYPLQGSTAELRSTAITGLLRYGLENDVSLIGGIRAQAITKGEVALPFAGYTLSVDSDWRVGFVGGVAWERPDIAARVALTYNSAITHTLDSTEGGFPTGSFDTEVPQSVNLEFQTGVAADTLLFGSVRWVDWTEFDISPPAFGSSLVSYSNDRVTYNLGLGRRFNETWSGAVTLGYEASDGEITGNLGPTDGYTSMGLATTYTAGNTKITGGIRYVDIGDATTSIGAQFQNNYAIAAGVRVGFSF